MRPSALGIPAARKSSWSSDPKTQVSIMKSTSTDGNPASTCSARKPYIISRVAISTDSPEPRAAVISAKVAAAGHPLVSVMMLCRSADRASSASASEPSSSKVKASCGASTGMPAMPYVTHELTGSSHAVRAEISQRHASLVPETNCTSKAEQRASATQAW